MWLSLGRRNISVLVTWGIPFDGYGFSHPLYVASCSRQNRHMFLGRSFNQAVLFNLLLRTQTRVISGS